HTAPFGTDFSFAFSPSAFRRPDHDFLTYSCDTGFVNMIVANGALNFSGHVGKIDHTYTIAVTASDGVGGSASASFELIFRNSEIEPQVLPGGDGGPVESPPVDPGVIVTGPIPPRLTRPITASVADDA